MDINSVQKVYSAYNKSKKELQTRSYLSIHDNNLFSDSAP